MTTYSVGWSAAKQVTRSTVDLSGFPDLVVMYLGMRVNRLRGIPTLLRFGRRIRHAVDAKPDGLLLHESLFFSPRQVGMRQYWRDFDSLELWARTPPHRDWWREYLQDTQGTGFWHETYFAAGGMEAIYDNMAAAPIGLMRVAPVEPAQGGMFTARRRIRREGEARFPPPVVETGWPQEAGTD
jgi:hypothetical protein